MTTGEFADLIDHSLLKPDTGPGQIEQLCEEAIRFRFGAVCVSPSAVAFVAKSLEHKRTRIATVIGFPHGNTLTSVKSFEAGEVIRDGAHELDMVIHLGALKAGDHNAVGQDIRSVVRAGQDEGEKVLVKVILETALLTNTEIETACNLAEEAGAHFVKTSTGFSGAGATTHAVALMRRTVGDRLGVKAAGGIRNLATALAMLDAGANRLGCTSSVAILNEFEEENRGGLKIVAVP